MTGDIEDAEWEEIPGNNGNLSKLSSPTPDFKGAQTQASAPAAKSALGGWWKDMPMLGKAILIVFGFSFLLSFCSSDPSAPSSGTQTAQAEPGDANSNAKPAASMADAAAPPSGTLSLDEQILGSWAEAPRGGADGKTPCNDFTGWLKLNKGRANQLVFGANGRVANLALSNPNFDAEDPADVTLKNNQGIWSIDDGVLFITWTGGTFGNEADLPPGEFSAGLTIDGNEMIHTFDKGQSRFVRCQE